MDRTELAARVVVLGTAAAFAAVAGWVLVTPTGALGSVGVAPTDATGLVELRAMYGGLELGAAAFFVWCGTAASRLRVGLVATVLMVGGLGAVRAIGVVVDGPVSVLMPSFVALELGGAALAAVLLTRLPAR